MQHPDFVGRDGRSASSVPSIGGRAADIAAERARLLAHRARRDIEGSEASRSGFALRRWHRAGVLTPDAVDAVRDVLERVDQATSHSSGPADALAVIRQALTDDPVVELPAALRETLMLCPADVVLEALSIIHLHGVQWMPEHLRPMLGLLVDSADGRIVDVAGVGRSATLALLAALTHGRMADISVVQAQEMLGWAPSWVVDELVDTGVLTTVGTPWSLRPTYKERSYLQARLDPTSVSNKQSRSLDWPERKRRSTFLTGTIELLVTDGLSATQSGSSSGDGGMEADVYALLAEASDGDVTRLGKLERVLPRHLVAELRALRAGADVGTWPGDVLEDLGTWRLLAALWQPKAAVDPRRSAFHARIALIHAYHLILAGDLRRAEMQVQQLTRHLPAHHTAAVEAQTMMGYLALLRDDLDAAEAVLAPTAPWSEVAATNLSLIRSRKSTTRNDRPHPANPYFELGLPHGSKDWHRQYREMRLVHQDPVHRDLNTRINRAMARIRQAELDDDSGAFFVLPIDPAELELPPGRLIRLVPPLAPMPRRTAPIGPKEISSVRERAAAELLPHMLGTPARPDRHERNNP